MAEVQTNTQSGEMSQRFIEFVMMQAQNAALFLGRFPTANRSGEVNLDWRKCSSITRHDPEENRATDERRGAVLRNTLSNLQMAFVEVSHKRGGGKTESAAQPEPVRKPVAFGIVSAEKTRTSPHPQAESESRKKFTKSYART